MFLFAWSTFIYAINLCKNEVNSFQLFTFSARFCRGVEKFFQFFTLHQIMTAHFRSWCFLFGLMKVVISLVSLVMSVVRISEIKTFNGIKLQKLQRSGFQKLLQTGRDAKRFDRFIVEQLKSLKMEFNPVWPRRFMTFRFLLVTRVDQQTWGWAIKRGLMKEKVDGRNYKHASCPPVLIYRRKLKFHTPCFFPSIICAELNVQCAA